MMDDCANYVAPAFFSHGGGPAFFMEGGMMSEIDKNSEIVRKYKLMGPKVSPVKPDAILVISAHWEEDKPTVTAGSTTKLEFDYYGFPGETYELSYPVPGSPSLSQRVLDLLKEAGISSRKNAERGLDHGVFVPLMLTHPKADIPVVALSLNRNLDPQQHIAIGRALEPLTHENILIVASGEATHNLREMGRPGGRVSRWAKEWDDWLFETLTSDTLTADEREDRLVHWDKAPHARKAHPREEHFIPLLVAFGAAGEKSRATRILDGWALETLSLSSYQFGLN